jgi:amino acid transporter
MAIFFLMSLVAFGVVPSEELAKSSFAMSDAAHRFLPWWGGAVVTIGALMAFTTSLNATLYVPARILYVFGEDRMLPQWLGRVSVRFRTPWVSLVVNTVLALTLLWTKKFGYVLNIALVAIFLLYGLHSLSLIALPFVRPELYKKAEVRPRPLVLVACGLVSFAAMAYLAIATIGRDIAAQSALPPDQRGFALWEMLLIWSLVGTVLYVVARWEGRKTGFDYKGQLTKDWQDE